MSLSTLQAQHCTIQFAKEAFPRFQRTQQRIRDIVGDVKGFIENVAGYCKWTYTMDNPHLVLCYGNEAPSIDLNEIAVHLPYQIQIGQKISTVDDSAPVLLICVIKSNLPHRGLTYFDSTMLNVIRDLPNEILDNALFAIDQPEDLLTTTAFFNLSDNIATELKRSTNDICHRLFRLHDHNIGIRASLYLERQMLSKYKTSKSKLQQTFESTKRLVKQLTEQRYFYDYGNFLNCGPFHYRNCLQFMIDAANEYRWNGESKTRNKWTVDEVKKNVVRHICEKLGHQITESLIEKFQSDVKAADLNISDFLFRNIDVSGIRQAVSEFVIFHIIHWIWEGVKAAVILVTTFFFTENLNSRSFRNRVAQSVNEQIAQNKDEIVRYILDKFKELQLPKLQELMTSLHEILNATEALLACRNEIDCFYHELKIISSRSKHILSIGCDGGHFCAYIQNSSVKAPETENYLSKYLVNAIQVEICEFKEMIVNEYATLQSGDTIIRGPLNNSYGTLGFLLTNRHSEKYCATCKHVTLGLPASQIFVRSYDGSIYTATITYEPSATLDFAVLKLDDKSGSLSLCTGLRNKRNAFVPGQVFMPDEFTLGLDTPVYKWGSATKGTTGLYRETYELLNQTEESFPWIIIKNDGSGNFAEKGDSGSLVCFTERDSEVAACLLIGAYSDPDTFACCRIADGLSLIKRDIPDICHLFHD